jgi:hypothetical protein
MWMCKRMSMCACACARACMSMCMFLIPVCMCQVCQCLSMWWGKRVGALESHVVGLAQSSGQDYCQSAITPYAITPYLQARPTRVFFLKDYPLPHAPISTLSRPPSCELTTSFRPSHPLILSSCSLNIHLYKLIHHHPLHTSIAWSPS